MNEGFLANAAVTLVAAASYLFVARSVAHQKGAERRSWATVMLFLLIGLHLALAGLRQVVGWFALSDPVAASLEPFVFYATVVPAAAAIVPLAMLTTYAVSGKDGLANVVGAGFLTVVATGSAFVFLGGISGPDVTYWGSEWTINSPVAKLLLILFITLPALVSSVVLVYTGSKVPTAAGRRIHLVGWSCLLYYVLFTVDALGLAGVGLLVARLGMASAALIGYRAYARGGTTDRAAAPALG